MQRRDILKYLSAGGLALSLPMRTLAGGSKQIAGGSGFALDDNKLRFFHPGISKEFNIMMLADTHLFRDDERGDPFRQYSGRMAKAYNVTEHYRTGEATNPEKSFVQALQYAADQKVSQLAIIGDLFSFPSEAAVDWVKEKLTASGLPFLYTAGNHDWHYEGLPGSSMQLRNTWINNRLGWMYQQSDPLMHAVEINGVCIISIDNSTYQILPEQLLFLQQKLAAGKPTLLMLHIPLYAPGRSLGFGCGHPNWNAVNDKNFELERRERWPVSGHSETTKDFHATVLKSGNIIGVVAGHTHRQSLDLLNGIPQVVTTANAVGAWLDISFHTLG